MINFRTFLRIARPPFLILAALADALGAGMARYLGKPLNLLVFSLGLLITQALQTTAFLLVENFRLPLTTLAQGETRFDREQFRIFLLQVSGGSLAISAAAVVSLLYLHLLSLPVDLILILVFLVPVVYAVPPFQLERSGFGEFVLAIYLAMLLPVFSFLLQAGQYHRLLAMTTFPLTLLCLAFLLVLNFQTFASDQKLTRQTLLTRVTWQRAIPIHHLLILAAFMFFATDPYFGFPWRVMWPVFLALPFAGLQIYWLQRIGRGGKPQWNLLITLAYAVFGLTVYLLTLSFWIH
jgi:1,4-dihydroxy-2-naphthoate octaprenyltransferase